MTTAVRDLLPRDAEVARRAAGGDGAAFVRLYDQYSTDVFTTALAATGSVEAAADATQTAFLRILRWPPPLGAPDDHVAELLYALALGGSNGDAPASSDTPEAQALARLVGVGWLRSETVAEAGARFDADWSIHLWSPPRVDPPPPKAWPRVRLPRLSGLRVPVPSPAFGVTAVLALLLFASAGGTILASGGSEPTEPSQVSESRKAEVDKTDRRAPRGWGQPRMLRHKGFAPLLAP